MAGSLLLATGVVLSPTTERITSTGVFSSTPTHAVEGEGGGRPPTLTPGLGGIGGSTIGGTAADTTPSRYLTELVGIDDPGKGNMRCGLFRGGFQGYFFLYSL